MLQITHLKMQTNSFFSNDFFEIGGTLFELENYVIVISTFYFPYSNCWIFGAILALCFQGPRGRSSNSKVG